MTNGAAAHAPVPVTALERRYRRLLRWYPPSHRAAHREEMLDILLATARPGQRVPGVTQTVNLVACGLAIRARRALLAGPWRDALAVVSLIAPVLMLVLAALNLAWRVREAVVLHQAILDAGPFWQLGPVPDLRDPATVFIAWLAVVFLGLTGRRRAAAAVASVLLALVLTRLLTLVMLQIGAWSGGLPEFLPMDGVSPVSVVSLAACSLAFSAGPRQGLAIVGQRRAWLMIAGLSAAFGLSVITSLISPDAPLPATVYSLIDVLVIAVAIAVTRVPGTAGGRVAVLVAAGLLTGLAGSIPSSGRQSAGEVILIGNLLIAALVWPAAIVSWKGRVRRA